MVVDIIAVVGYALLFGAILLLGYTLIDLNEAKRSAQFYKNMHHDALQLSISLLNGSETGRLKKENKQLQEDAKLWEEVYKDAIQRRSEDAEI